MQAVQFNAAYILCCTRDACFTSCPCCAMLPDAWSWSSLGPTALLSTSQEAQGLTKGVNAKQVQWDMSSQHYGAGDDLGLHNVLSLQVVVGSDEEGVRPDAGQGPPASKKASFCRDCSMLLVMQSGHIQPGMPSCHKSSRPCCCKISKQKQRGKEGSMILSITTCVAVPRCRARLQPRI